MAKGARGLLILCGVALALLVPASASANDPACEQTTDVGEKPAAGPGTPAPTTTFESTGAAQTLNLGGDDDTGSVDISVSSSPALPASVTPDQISIEVPQRFRRSADKLETEYIDDLSFSNVKILTRGKLIAFSLCVGTDGLEAGSYPGQVIVVGPGDTEPATIAVTVNKKDGFWFWFFLGVALSLAFVMLVIQSARTPYGAARGSVKQKLKKALGQTFTDGFGFWAPTVVALAAAFAAMWQVYSSDPSWGADTLSSILALAGTAISAAGLGTFLGSLKPKKSS